MSLFRIASRDGNTLATAQSLGGWAYVIGRHLSPGRYEVEVIGEDAPSSPSGKCLWGAVVRRDDGRVILEPGEPGREHGQDIPGDLSVDVAASALRSRRVFGGL